MMGAIRPLSAPKRSASSDTELADGRAAASTSAKNGTVTERIAGMAAKYRRGAVAEAVNASSAHTTLPESFADGGEPPAVTDRTCACPAAYPSSRLGELVYSVGDINAARASLDLAAQDNAALVYTTNDKLNPNPWDTLPTYWSALVSEICLRNGGSAAVCN